MPLLTLPVESSASLVAGCATLGVGPLSLRSAARAARDPSRSVRPAPSQGLAEARRRTLRRLTSRLRRACRTCGLVAFASSPYAPLPRFAHKGCSRVIRSLGHGLACARRCTRHSHCSTSVHSAHSTREAGRSSTPAGRSTCGASPPPSTAAWGRLNAATAARGLRHCARWLPPPSDGPPWGGRTLRGCGETGETCFDLCLRLDLASPLPSPCPTLGLAVGRKRPPRQSGAAPVWCGAFAPRRMPVPHTAGHQSPIPLLYPGFYPDRDQSQIFILHLFEQAARNQGFPCLDALITASLLNPAALRAATFHVGRRGKHRPPRRSRYNFPRLLMLSRFSFRLWGLPLRGTG